MSGFSAESVAFLAALRDRNDREWFEANRDVYDRAVRDAARDFAAALEVELAAALGQACESRIFRINRDLRFSRDKTPYHTHVHMSFWPSAAGASGPVWMLGLEPGKLTVGAGTMRFAPAQLQRWRDSVSGPAGADLSQRLDRLATAAGARLSEAALVRVPAPYPNDHVRADLLRRKGIVVWRDLEGPERAYGAAGPGRCRSALLDFEPVVEWLRSHVAAG